MNTKPRTQTRIALAYAERGLESRVTPIREMPSFHGWTDEQIGQYLCEITAAKVGRASDRRAAINAAARVWLDSGTDESTQQESNIRLDGALYAAGVVSLNSIVTEVWSDAPETLMVRLSDGTLIEIDVESGNFLRGEAA